MKSFFKFITFLSLSLCLSNLSTALEALESKINKASKPHHNDEYHDFYNLTSLTFTFDTTFFGDTITGTYTAAVALPDNTIRTAQGIIGDGTVSIQLNKAPQGSYLINLILNGVSGSIEAREGPQATVTVLNTATKTSVILPLIFDIIPTDPNSNITIGSQASAAYPNAFPIF